MDHKKVVQEDWDQIYMTHDRGKQQVFEHDNEHSGLVKCGALFQLADKLLACLEEVCPTEPFIYYVRWLVI